MTYATSDLHGYPLEKFKALLSQVNFSEDDFLYIIGDVIDRGPEGAELLLWITQQPNIQLLMGNHEMTLLSFRFLFEEVNDESLAKLSSEKLDLLSRWFQNGANQTLTGLKKILKADPETFEGIWEYIQDAPLYEEITVGNTNYVLVHAGLGHFIKEKPLEDYTIDELVWTRPSMDVKYYDDKYVIFGHTPTFYFDPSFDGKAIVTETWTCIDTGAAAGKDPMLFCLDTKELIYKQD